METGQESVMIAMTAGGAASAPRHALLLRQFAEAFYLMVMASDMRGRVRALGRRYGLEAMEMRAEVLRYLANLAGEPPLRSRSSSAAFAPVRDPGP